MTNEAQEQSPGSPEPKFWVRPGYTGGGHALEISAERFAQLRNARSVLTEMLAIEQKYEVLVRNYVDFEKEILNRLATELISDPVEYLDFYEHLLAFDVRLVNFLASASLYTGQVPSHVGRSVGKEGADAARKLQNVEYDASAAYRFMAALRNHVLHAGLPVHGMGLNGGWVELAGHRYLEHTVELTCKKSTLLADETFKKSVLDEIPDAVDLSTAVRSYMSSLSTVHMGVRKLLNLAGESSRAIVTRAIEDYARQANSEVGDWEGVGLRAEHELGGKIEESVLLVIKWDDLRLQLVARNRKLVNLPRRHVSGRSRGKGALNGQPKLDSD